MLEWKCSCWCKEKTAFTWAIISFLLALINIFPQSFTWTLQQQDMLCWSESGQYIQRNVFSWVRSAESLCWSCQVQYVKTSREEKQKIARHFCLSLDGRDSALLGIVRLASLTHRSCSHRSVLNILFLSCWDRLLTFVCENLKNWT